MGHHGYQVGGATAKHPLGPWTKLPENPLLQPGSLSAWDGGEVASSNIVKMGEGNWTMWCVNNSSRSRITWSSAQIIPTHVDMWVW